MYIWQDRFAFIILITVGFSLQHPVIDFVGFLFPVVLQVRMAVFNQHHVDGLDLTVNPLLYMMRCYPVSSSVISGYCRIYESSPGGYLRWIFSTQYLSQISTLGLINTREMHMVLFAGCAWAEVEVTSGFVWRFRKSCPPAYVYFIR